MSGCVHVGGHARVHVRACVHAHVCACVCAGVRVCTCVHVYVNCYHNFEMLTFPCFCFRQWLPKSCDKLIAIMEAWIHLLPEWVVANILDQLVMPKLMVCNHD